MYPPIAGNSESTSPAVLKCRQRPVNTHQTPKHSSRPHHQEVKGHKRTAVGHLWENPEDPASLLLQRSSVRHSSTRVVGSSPSGSRDNSR